MKLIIHKFKTIAEKTIQLPAMIQGGNGTGKTTILEALSFCLTGKNMDGKEFKQIYDNRVDLHEALADVSYFDDYGNEYRRTVSPTFQTSRDGQEKIKTLQNTVCKKNGISGNDYACDFGLFQTFGTDYFFRQTWDVQRKIFVEALKSRMPAYDINGNSLKLKELEKAAKQALSEIETGKSLLKNTIDPEIPEMDANLLREIEKYNEAVKSFSDNANQVAEVNRRNNEAMATFWQQTREIEQVIQQSNSKILNIDLCISGFENSIASIKDQEFKANEPRDISALQRELSGLHMSLQSCMYSFYDSIEDYASENFSKNSVLVENAQKIKEIQARVFDVNSASGACPLSGEECKTVKLHAEQAFNTANQNEIARIKQANRLILEREMTAANNEYNSISAKIDRINSEIAQISAENLKIKQKNEELKKSFEAEKQSRIEKVESEIKKLEAEKLDLLNTVQSLEIQLSGIKEPEPEKLPEALEIPAELVEAKKQFDAQDKLISEAIGVQKYNSANRAKWSAEIESNRAVMFDLNQQITMLKNQISDYFQNLKDIVKTEFPGEIEIGVELLKYVMTRDEYDPDFKITANGNAFPYECNGALQNNLKLQVLAGLQKLSSYNGPTVMDNCEANTTNPINTCGLPCLLAQATNIQTLNI